MYFDDLPLVDIEKEVFSDCGAWKNWHDLEDSLTLEELTELYSAAMEKHNRLARLFAAMNGIDLEESSEVQSVKKYSSDYDYREVTGAGDLVGLEYGLGYQTG